MAKISVNYNYEFEVTVNLSVDTVINKILEGYVISIINEFIRICPAYPPAGVHNIDVYFRSAGPYVNIAPKSGIIYYCIGLQVNDDNYKELMYQLGHELCHIFTDPRRSNWFVESCCEMMARILLSKMAGEVMFPPNEIELRKWFCSVKSSLGKAQNGDRNKKIAQMLMPIFEKSPDKLEVLNYLGKASDSPPKSLQDCDPCYKIPFKFSRWEEAVPSSFKGLVRRIRRLFENNEQQTICAYFGDIFTSFFRCLCRVEKHRDATI